MSWYFIVLVAAVSGFGVYLGRFLRFNSWDLVMRPMDLMNGIGRWAATPFSQSNSYAFPIMFGVFILTTYILLYGLTHLRQLPQAPAAKLADNPLAL